MIIKSIFRRYERWNPVHPTSGAFWGIGVGIGCGIGWGPGFGPEVIGYVGAGCGAGFNVGFTLLGVGIGLPSNYLYAIPHSGLIALFIIAVAAFTATKIRALDGNLPGNGSIGEDGWGANRWNMADVHKNLRASFSGLKVDSMADSIRDLPDVKSMLVSHAKHITDCLQRVHGGFFPQDRGSKS